MAAYNRYQGNSGRVIRVQEEPERQASRSGKHLSQPHTLTEPPAPSKPAAQAQRVQPHAAGTQRKQAQAPPPVPAGNALGRRLPLTQPSGRLPELFGGLLEWLSPQQMETEDLILLLILYLLYRDSGDSELLIMMGAMFLL